MRPYGLRKEDGKYGLSNQQHQANAIQPSPLALLAATCSRIGDTLYDEDATTLNSQKKFPFDRDDVTNTKSCMETRSSAFSCMDQNYNLLSKQASFFDEPPSLLACMKIKNEELDTDKEVHVCPIVETRLHEDESRLTFTKSSCSHVDNFTTCDQTSTGSHVTYTQQSSCLFEESSSCEQINFQGSALHNLQQPTAMNHNINDHLNKSYIPWQEQRSEVSSCMLEEDALNNNLNIPSLQRSLQNTPLSHPNNISNQYVGQSYQQDFIYNTSYQQHNVFPHYNESSSVEVKQEPYMMQNYRQSVPSYNPNNHLTYPSPHPYDMKWGSTRQQPMQSMTPPDTLHNHPAGVSSTFCPACNATQVHQEMSMGRGIMPGDMQNIAEMQYQQQQMFYARDNRRPRRIACTCPNCRDGENKTVTTKDGKQRKLHVCHVPGCEKIYGKTSHLRAHLRWHAGERPFACNWLFCNKRFTRSDELQRHRRTHTGDKRFECSTCLKKFMRSDHLSKHMKTHQSQQAKNKSEESKNPIKITEKSTKAAE